MSTLEPLSSRPLAQGRVKSLVAHQQINGRVRAWVLDPDGIPCALDDAPISRGVKSAAVQLETHDVASIASSGSPALQVCPEAQRSECLELAKQLQIE